jgi:hypothetical protein
MLVIGPLGLMRDENDKIKLYIEKNTLFWGGIAGTTPIENSNISINTISSILIAGPIVQLLSGLIFIFVFLYSSKIFFLLLGAMAVGVSIMCLIPLPRIGGVLTDGTRWLKIRKNKEYGLVETAFFNIAQSYYKYRNCSQINFSDVSNLINNEDPCNQYMGHYFLMHYYKDNGDIENMEEEIKYLENLEEKLPVSFIKIYNYKDA